MEGAPRSPRSASALRSRRLRRATAPSARGSPPFPRPPDAGRGGGRSSPASPAGPAARGSVPWRRRRRPAGGAGSPQAAPGDGAELIAALPHSSSSPFPRAGSARARAAAEGPVQARAPRAPSRMRPRRSSALLSSHLLRGSPRPVRRYVEMAETLDISRYVLFLPLPSSRRL